MDMGFSFRHRPLKPQQVSLDDQYRHRCEHFHFQRGGSVLSPHLADFTKARKNPRFCALQPLSRSSIIDLVIVSIDSKHLPFCPPLDFGRSRPSPVNESDGFIHALLATEINRWPACPTMIQCSSLRWPNGSPRHPM